MLGGMGPDGGGARWHTAWASQVLGALSTTEARLSSAEAQRRLLGHGPNLLTRRSGPSAWRLLARRFTSPLIYGLLVSAGVAFALGESPTAPWCSASSCSTR
jgi:magnesium-transporting ATPase (P-type)